MKHLFQKFENKFVYSTFTETKQYKQSKMQLENLRVCKGIGIRKEARQKGTKSK